MRTRWLHRTGALAVLALTSTTSGAQWSTAELRELTAPDPGQFNVYGHSTGMSGTTVLVGAPNTNPHGAAYVHERDQGGVGTWGAVAKLTKRNGAVSDAMGFSVGVSGDTAVVGARGDNHSGFSNAGSALVFERDQGGPIEGLAFDPLTQTLYGVEVSSDQLVALDVRTGAGTRLGEVGFERVRGLAFDPVTGTLYGSDTELDVLLRIDTGTGAGTAIGPIGFGNVAGLACDPGSGALYGSDVDSDQLLAIDPATGAGVAIGALGFGRVHGLSFDPGSGTLYGADTLSDQLLAIDTATGAATALGALGFGTVEALGFDSTSGTLYGLDLEPARLLEVDPFLGGASEIGRVTVPDGWGEVATLVASDPHDKGDFGVSVAIDADTIVVGASDFGFGTGAAYVFERDLGGADAWGERTRLIASDAALGNFFGWSVSICGDTILVGSNRTLWTSAGSAYVFERDLGGADAWGEAALLTGSGGSAFDNYGVSTTLLGDLALVGAADDGGPGAAYVYARNEGGPGAWGEIARLTASDGHALDKFGSAVATSGSMYLVGASGAEVNAGAAYLFDASFGEVAKWTSSDVGPGDGFGYTASMLGGIAVIGSPDHALSGMPVSGAAYAFALSESTPYCTAGTSASGCQAALVGAGTASASFGFGFELVATGVEGSKEGMFYFGTSGRQALPWGNGTSFQCVVPPVTRAGVLSGSGLDGTCTGAFIQDVNALWCASCPQPQKNPGAGATVQAQLWYRDPLSTSNRTTSLSTAVEFALQP